MRKSLLRYMSGDVKLHVLSINALHIKCIGILISALLVMLTPMVAIAGNTVTAANETIAPNSATAANTANGGDSIIGVIDSLTQELEKSKQNETSLRLEVEHLNSITVADSTRHARLRARIDSLKLITPATWIVVDGDSLFSIYAKQGGLAPKERALITSEKIEQLGHSFTTNPDSLKIMPSEFETDIIYDDKIIISITELDGIWAGTTRDSLATTTKAIIASELTSLKERYGMMQLVKRVLSFIMIIIALYVIIKLINKGYRWLVRFITRLGNTKLKTLYIQNVELLDKRKQVRLLVIILRLIRAVVYIALLLLTLPLVFSIFPQTKSLAERIIGYVWHPFYSILCDIVAYIPNLFTICVIFIVVRYLVKIVRYFANAVEKEQIKINGFFADWAMPTFYIVRFLLYAFMIAMIYPYLPGSNSGVFQGISVFVGLIVSLGSSSIIGNLMAGLVITYMRPFKMGDRVEVKDVTGNVIEKTPFVTRIRTPKNEVVTLPNSFIMSSQTINYSQSAQQYGLIIHTDVTMGYEIPWRKITNLLIDAALNTPGVVDDPRPFVLQTSLGDHYTVYQLNAYIRDANLLPDIYSTLHESIQDYFAREGLELLSPHYISTRDGNPSTVPPH